MHENELVFVKFKSFNSKPWHYNLSERSKAKFYTATGIFLISNKKKCTMKANTHGILVRSCVNNIFKEFDLDIED
jgi:hypothetical protein